VAAHSRAAVSARSLADPQFASSGCAPWRREREAISATATAARPLRNKEQSNHPVAIRSSSDRRSGFQYRSIRSAKQPSIGPANGSEQEHAVACPHARTTLKAIRLGLDLLFAASVATSVAR
jgi:hypothetical protein